MTLVIEGLTKSYGAHVAISDLTFSVPEGQVFGLLGLNGAGKSTTIRIILDILSADKGVVTWKDIPTKNQLRHHFGYLPEERGLYQKMKVIDHLVLFGRLQGMERRHATDVAMNWLERFEIPHYRDKQVADLSKGNQQKIQFIAAVLHHPEVMILDEPFSGLDPVNTSLFKSIITELAASGATILFSSHQLEHVEELSDSIAIIHESKLALSGPVQEIISQVPPRFIRLRTDVEAVRAIVGHQLTVDERHGTIEVPAAAISSQDLLQQLVKAGVMVSHFELVRPTLNDVFLQKVGKVS
jgi:ABC-2 type transport system ATP-binding protein